MIHALAKTYGISPIEAGKLHEEHFWLLTGFEGYNQLRMDSDNPKQ